MRLRIRRRLLGPGPGALRRRRRGGALGGGGRRRPDVDPPRPVVGPRPPRPPAFTEAAARLDAFVPDAFFAGAFVDVAFVAGVPPDRPFAAAGPGDGVRVPGAGLLAVRRSPDAPPGAGPVARRRAGDDEPSRVVRPPGDAARPVPPDARERPFGGFFGGVTGSPCSWSVRVSGWSRTRNGLR
ncbi:hypothetical protein JQN72_07690 [Phycicoccus sp. CSK15P-2]|uniref:hypothetical protein n=1 Tax=Phycicoccus sp. CSK15P-2 TaxID=2807627 RepID=UPI0019522B2A|nr:hypothetical protein [Phycicoccus sp. CSK15P-2]MBM6404124.1 hypothetical protein [Phycicoccus sp. CSK15P-2]